MTAEQYAAYTNNVHLAIGEDDETTFEDYVRDAFNAGMEEMIRQIMGKAERIDPSEMSILEKGNYILEVGMTLERTGNFITVRQNKKYQPNEVRCNDCFYFGHGRAVMGGFWTTVCLKQPKNRVDRYGEQLYYHIGNRKNICKEFKPKK